MKFIHWIAVCVLGVAVFVGTLGLFDRTQHESRPNQLRDSKSIHHPSTLRPTPIQRTANPQPEQDGKPKKSPTLAEAISRVKACGDYGLLRRVLSDMDTKNRHLFLWADLVCLQSPRGVAHDYRESLDIIKDYGEANSASLAKTLGRMTGLRLDPAKDKDFVRSLDPDAWKAMIAGVVEENAPKAFDFANVDWGEPHQRIACAEATKIWLEMDALAVSSRLMRMPSSDMKDVAISEMVDWLVRKESADEAAAWIAEISDNDLREKMSSLIRTQRK